MPATAYLNRVSTAVPDYEAHDFFLRYASFQLADSPRERKIFNRMSNSAGIESRYSVVPPASDPEGMYADETAKFRRGAFPGTATRMDLYAEHAPQLATRAVDGLALGSSKPITHLIVTSCTGFSAPGIDLEIIARCGLSTSIERTIVGFMGCYAAINALKLARHIVRSEPDARVLVVNIELCTLHLKDTKQMEDLVSFGLWGDGCAASLVTSDPAGIAIDSFKAIVAEETRELMSWHIRDDGFDMVLSGRVPAAIQDTLNRSADKVLGGQSPENIALWAVHPGGRTVLDAVQRALKLEPDALRHSRDVLRENGNMSSATVMFVFDRILREMPAGAPGCGMAFGPGLTAETMLFHTVGEA